MDIRYEKHSKRITRYMLHMRWVEPDIQFEIHISSVKYQIIDCTTTWRVRVH